MIEYRYGTAGDAIDDSHEGHAGLLLLGHLL